MKYLCPPHGAALAALFVAAACGSGDPAATATAKQEAGEVTEAVAQVPALPDAPDDISTEAYRPLNDAGEIASEIASDTSVERVPYEGGWAWRKDGEILRTVSADGRRVAYFWPGEDEPFFVQQGDRSYAYDDGHVERAYDRNGRPAPVPAALRDDAERLADRSSRQRELADHGG